MAAPAAKAAATTAADVVVATQAAAAVTREDFQAVCDEVQYLKGLLTTVMNAMPKESDLALIGWALSTVAQERVAYVYESIPADAASYGQLTSGIKFKAPAGRVLRTSGPFIQQPLPPYNGIVPTVSWRMVHIIDGSSGHMTAYYVRDVDENGFSVWESHRSHVSSTSTSQYPQVAQHAHVELGSKSEDAPPAVCAPPGIDDDDVEDEWKP
jgi:hypothetical protein